MVVHCASRSTQPYFVANVMNVIVLCVLIHIVVGTKLFICCTMFVKCAVEVEFITVVLCCVLFREGFGVDSGLLGGFLSGEVQPGLQSGYLVQK